MPGSGPFPLMYYGTHSANMHPQLFVITARHTSAWHGPRPELEHGTGSNSPDARRRGQHAMKACTRLCPLCGCAEHPLCGDACPDMCEMCGTREETMPCPASRDPERSSRSGYAQHMAGTARTTTRKVYGPPPGNRQATALRSRHSSDRGYGL